ncbi:Os01g0758450 [Oryza sativa Japonica Group]|uniref:Os01g0758450 protein n=1 Tax=Oryza sativa subsp. japonica TaxID=39947 RepID=A0A0P0V8C8_ORYSJ|nr:Os01g0758450 [Oryza sativa Japonica Group]
MQTNLVLKHATAQAKEQLPSKGTLWHPFSQRIMFWLKHRTRVTTKPPCRQVLKSFAELQKQLTEAFISPQKQI